MPEAQPGKGCQGWGNCRVPFLTRQVVQPYIIFNLWYNYCLATAPSTLVAVAAIPSTLTAVAAAPSILAAVAAVPRTLAAVVAVPRTLAAVAAAPSTLAAVAAAAHNKYYL